MTYFITAAVCIILIGWSGMHITLDIIDFFDY